MPELTGQDIHEAFLQARKENYTDKVAWGASWQYLNAEDRLFYDRMADLLNEKIKHTTPYKPEMEMK